MIIAICGKSGSGKSTLANDLLNKYKEKVIHCDIDKIGHKVLTIPEVQEELIRNFGNSIINNKRVDRKKLGQLVFRSHKEMEKLTKITWKYMQIEIDNCISENKEKIIILDWILLPNTKYFSMCDIKILLDISYEIRKERALKRDNITEELFKLRDSASIKYDTNNFNFVIKEDTKNTIKRLVKLL